MKAPPSTSSSALRYQALPFSTASSATLRACTLLVIWLAAICIDYLFAPSLYNSSPIWMIAALLLLILRSSAVKQLPVDFPAISYQRIALFIVLNAAVVLAGRHFESLLVSGVKGNAAYSAGLAAMKLAVLLLGAVLFSRASWRTFLKTYRAEWIASLIVLFTFFPYRLIRTVWPVYSQVLAKLAYWCARPFVAGIGYATQPMPTVTGPRLDLQVALACSGLSALILFDLLFGLVALVDWNELNHKRLLITYFVGNIVILITNVFRISLLTIVGNHIGPRYATGTFHVNAGWVFFSIANLIFLALTYRWLLDRKHTPAHQ
jgi:exosortase/archaeosortase family protein